MQQVTDVPVMVYVVLAANSLLLAVASFFLREVASGYRELRRDFYGKGGVLERLAVIEVRQDDAERDAARGVPDPGPSIFPRHQGAIFNARG